MSLRGKLYAMGTVAVVGIAGTLAVNADGPVLIGADDEVTTLSTPSPSSSSPESAVTVGSNGAELNLPGGPLIVVAREADSQDRIYGIRILPSGEKSETDVVDALGDILGEDVAAAPLLGHPLFKGVPAPATAGIAGLTATAVELESEEEVWIWTPVELATFRKVCEPGCAQWPEDPTCCTVFGCSGPWKDCIIIDLKQEPQ